MYKTRKVYYNSKAWKELAKDDAEVRAFLKFLATRNTNIHWFSIATRMSRFGLGEPFCEFVRSANSTFRKCQEVIS